MYVIVAFDTEDIYFPPECRIDDVPGWLAGIMTDVGITGTFFIMGEKAESLVARGRSDVCAKLAAHDIASHQQGNRFPLLPQVVEGKGWDEGVEAVRKYEDWAKEQHVRAFGKEPVAFSRHNCYFAPQHVAVAGERGLPYMYMIAQVPGSMQPMWYAGALTFPDRLIFAGFDTIYSRDCPFEARLKELDVFLSERQAAGAELVVVFGCHPIMVMGRGWLEHYTLTTGRSRTPEQVGWRYAVKPRYEEEAAKANFRRLCVHLKERDDLEVVGISEAARLFSSRPSHVTRDALVAYASELTATNEIAFDRVYSPAEMLCALADSLVHFGSAGDVPEEVVRRDVLGPAERPVRAREVDSVSHGDLVAFSAELVRQVEAHGRLPANLEARDGRLGISQICLLAARAYLALTRYDKYERLAVPYAPRYPGAAWEIDQWVRRNIGDHWAMPLDFSCDKLAELARLQTWTMKPAWLHTPQPRPAGSPHEARHLG